MALRLLPRRKRTRRICIFSYKGGCTKTTTAVNLCSALCRLGRRVRLWDLDPQDGSATLWLPPKVNVGGGLERLYNDRGTTLADVTAPTSVHGLSIIPSYESLRAIDQKNEMGTDRVIAKALRDADGEYPVFDGDAYDDRDVDYDVFDCLHTLGPLVAGAMEAADELWIPVQPSLLDVAGLEQLIDLGERIQALVNPNLWISTVVIGRVKGNAGLDAELLRDTREKFPNATVASIADSVEMRRATKNRMPIDAHAPKSSCASDFAELARITDERVAA